MSGKGDFWDNACMESFWSTLKNELVNHEQYATREQGRQSIFEYIEVQGLSILSHIPGSGPMPPRDERHVAAGPRPCS